MDSLNNEISIGLNTNNKLIKYLLTQKLDITHIMHIVFFSKKTISSAY